MLYHQAAAARHPGGRLQHTAQELARILSLLSRMVATVDVDSPSAQPILLSFSQASKHRSTSTFTCGLMALQSRSAPPHWLLLCRLFRPETGKGAARSTLLSPDITNEHLRSCPVPADFSATAARAPPAVKREEVYRWGVHASSCKTGKDVQGHVRQSSLPTG